MKKHYRVYYLLDPLTGEILYIGRTSRKIKERMKEHRKEKRLPRELLVGLCQRFTISRDSKNAETRAIKKHCPKFNRIISHRIR